MLDFPTQVCLEGAKSRIGQKRDDLPWVEEKLDEILNNALLILLTKSCHKFISYWINIKLIIVYLFLNLEMRLIIIYVIWRKNMQIYNLKK